MKKIYLVLVAALMAAVMPVQVMAETPQLWATNNNGEIKVEIASAFTTEDASTILPEITTSTESVTQEITLKADADTEAALRLTISELPTSRTETPLNNCMVVISDADGNGVYNSETASEAKRNDSYKNMKIGELKAGEEKKYTVTYKLIDETVDMSKVSVVIAAKSNAVVPTAEPTPAPTLKPKFDFDSLEKQDEFVFDFSEELKNSTSTDPAQTVNEIKKVCGTDIPAGRFSVTGNGNLKISSAAGSLKSESVVSENPVAGKSVKTAVVLLEEGDVLTITPLEGDEKARLKFNKVSTAAVTTTATPVNPTAGAKTNPKTGDGSTGVVIGVAVLAVLAFVGLEILKRRGRTNN